MEKLIKSVASVFGIGYLPASGTLASLAGLAAGVFFDRFSGGYTYLLCAAILLGFMSSKKAEEIYNEKDSGKIVIDEFAGILLAFFHIPFKLFYVILGFALYRFFDIVKIYPMKRIERFSGATGIMGDDIVAGLYTNLILYVLVLVYSGRQFVR